MRTPPKVKGTVFDFDNDRQPVTWRYTAFVEGSYAGELTVHRKTVRTLCNTMRCTPAFRELGNNYIRSISYIETNHRHLRQGVATALYEAAAKDACRAAEPLVSHFRLMDAKSNEFWAKQSAKKRVLKVGVRTDDDDDWPSRKGEPKPPVYAHKCITTSFAGLKKAKKR